MTLAKQIETEDSDGIVLVDMAKNIIERIVLAIDTNSAIGQIATWLCDYTKLDADTDFSFKDHEMQIDIVNDISARQVVQKCSQVGLSEASSRKGLGITAISKNIHVMYVLPTRTFASKFATSRIRPIIDTSPMLTDQLNRNAKGSELIGLGSSFMHLGGTTGAATGAISVPASYVIIDELDFCDQEVVGKYESRLKHAKEDEHKRKGVVIKFSTPTVEEYGINKEFKVSDQKHYAVRCSCCETEFMPDYFHHIRIPNYDGKIIDISPEDINAGTYDIKNAYMQCPNCLSDVWEDLCNPDRRRWVAKYPESIVSGYQVHPWDVPKVNSIPSVLMQMTGYENIADYFNFTIGIPYSDHNNSFLMSPFSSGTYANWLPDYESFAGMRLCLGCDVGKTSHITIGYEDAVGKLRVGFMVRFKSSKKKLLGEFLVELIKKYKIRCAVIDAAPDFSTAQYVVKKFPYKTILGCEYTKNKTKGKLTNIQIKEEEHTISAYRTGVLTDLLKRHNSADVIYPDQEKSMKIKAEITEAKMNLNNIKKVKKLDNDGEDVEVFIKSGPDHYAHSLSYLNIATRVIGEKLVGTTGIRAPSGVTTFNTQGAASNAAKPVGNLYKRR